MESASDDELMTRVQANDQGAFAALLDRHLNQIVAFAFRMTNSRADAEDIAQETFLRAWNKAGTWRPGRVRLTTWLHTIAHNLCVDAFRKPRADVTDQIDRAATDDEEVSGRIHDDERRQLVRSELNALPESQRSAIVLCQLQGWSNREAADIMGVSVEAVESLLARGRRTLRKRLADRYEEIK